ncbi:MAG: protoporphyrinogen oxidase [Deltaproteobacteria bacterium]|nr:protoporphyrinogen oxidase [Deltaproteobacteria bacterium]
MSRQRIAIIGAGMSGLLAAYFAKRQGHSVQVFESQERAGGWVQSERIENRLYERGAQTLLADSDWLELLKELNLVPIEASTRHRSRFIWKNEKRCQAPLGFILFLKSDLFSFKAKARLLTEIFRTTKISETDLNLANFFERIFHRDIVDYALDPFVGGIFAGSIHDLSAKSCFPRIWDGIQEKGSVFRSLLFKSRSPQKKLISFKNGIQEITEALQKNIGSVDLQHSIGHLPQGFDQYILATPAGEAAKFLDAKISAESSHFLKSIPYRRVAIWQTVFDRPENFKSGFGCLIPRKEGQALLGSLWTSEIFEGRCSKDELLTTQFFSGSDIPSDPLIHLPFLQKVLGIQSQPKVSYFKIYERAIPQFEIYHRDKVQKLRSELPASISLVGNYLDGVGLSDVLTTAKRLFE